MLQQQCLVGVALQRVEGGVHPFDRTNVHVGMHPGACDGGVAVHAGDDGEATAQFVGAVPPDLALVSIFERLTAAASFAH